MIRLRALRLNGPSGRYDVDFDARESNLAVIAGQISTGKSTILEFVDYCLGSDEHPTHPEVATRVRSVALELEINGALWTIERPIFSAEQLAWVHLGGVDDKDAAIVRKNLEPPSVADSLSAWLIQSAGLEGLRLKVTAKNPNSPTNLMSFRDLMWLCYLPNRRLDNQALLFEDNSFKGYKLQQVIEVLFDVADQRLTDLMEQLTLLRSEHRDQVGEISSLQGFLRESGTPDRTEIERLRVDLSNRQTELEQQLTEVDGRMRQATDYADDLRAWFTTARRDSILAVSHLRDRRSLIERLLPLRGQYAEDERKLTFVGEARDLFNPLHVLTCPACLRVLQQAPGITDSRCTLCGQEVLLGDSDADFDVDAERKMTKERMRHLDRYVVEVEDEIVVGVAAVDQARAAERELEAELNNRVATQLSPFVSERENLIRSRERIRSQDAALNQAIVWHEGLERRQADLDSLEGRQKAVRTELEERRKNRPEKAEVVGDLSARFAELLREWGFPKVDDDGSPHMEDDFVPWIRGRPYREIGSSGALTLIAVAWELTLFERAVEEGLPHPGFLIIDSPQKNLSPDVVGDTEFLDPKIVERMWSHIASWCERHPEAQIVIVDNTPPPLVENRVIVRYSRDSNVPPYGLISDEMG
jgi:hypothetical protein